MLHYITITPDTVSLNILLHITIITEKMLLNILKTNHWSRRKEKMKRFLHTSCGDMNMQNGFPTDTI